MGHTYFSALFHCVFSTKNRQRLIPDHLQNDLWHFMGGIARQNGMTSLRVGGTCDHVHMVIAVPPTVALAKAMQLVKSGSSKWMNNCHVRGFRWQEGYGAFSIGISQLPATLRYIDGQREHHRKVSFEEEFLAFLKRNNVDYDPRFVLD
jgi:putative transposase